MTLGRDVIHPHRSGLALGSRGAAAFEFGLIGLALCFFLTLGVELFWQVAAATELDYGVREATRFGITGRASAAAAGSPACRSGTIIWLVTYTTPLAASQLSVASNTYTAGSGTVTAGTTGGAASQTEVYTFTYRQYFFTPIASALYGQAYIDHKSTTIIKNEAFSTATC